MDSRGLGGVDQQGHCSVSGHCCYHAHVPRPECTPALSLPSWLPGAGDVGGDMLGAGSQGAAHDLLCVCRRAPPGKCQIQAAHVKVRGRLVHFVPKESKCPPRWGHGGSSCHPHPLPLFRVWMPFLGPHAQHWAPCTGATRSGWSCLNLLPLTQCLPVPGHGGRLQGAAGLTTSMAKGEIAGPRQGSLRVLGRDRERGYISRLE